MIARAHARTDPQLAFRRQLPAESIALQVAVRWWYGWTTGSATCNPRLRTHRGRLCSPNASIMRVMAVLALVTCLPGGCVARGNTRGEQDPPSRSAALRRAPRAARGSTARCSRQLTQLTIQLQPPHHRIAKGRADLRPELRQIGAVPGVRSASWRCVCASSPTLSASICPTVDVPANAVASSIAASPSRWNAASAAGDSSLSGVIAAGPPLPAGPAGMRPARPSRTHERPSPSCSPDT